MNKIYFLIKNFLYVSRNIYFIFIVAKNYIPFLKILKIINKFLQNYFFSLFRLKTKYKNIHTNFKIHIAKLRFSNDWFTNNIPNWIFVFEQLQNEKINNILEIGSYEGMSSKFLLDYFQYSRIDCVETFTGSDEHKDIDFFKVENNFKFNLNNYLKRYRLFKMKSKKFFEEKLYEDKLYDLVYIDGSHHKDDVYQDAVNSFEILNKNGIIIFDDFLRQYYDNRDENVIGAVFKFIQKYGSEIKLIFIGYQIFIKKN